jgi:hypothetical protein
MFINALAAQDAGISGHSGADKLQALRPTPSMKTMTINPRKVLTIIILHHDQLCSRISHAGKISRYERARMDDACTIIIGIETTKSNPPVGISEITAFLKLGQGVWVYSTAPFSF